MTRLSLSFDLRRSRDDDSHLAIVWLSHDYCFIITICLDKLGTGAIFVYVHYNFRLAKCWLLVCIWCKKSKHNTIERSIKVFHFSLRIRSGLASVDTLADFATNDKSLALVTLTDFTTGSLTQLAIFIHIYTFSASAAQRENCISSYLTFACEFIIENQTKKCARIKILLFWPGPATHYQSRVSEQVRQVRRRQQKRSRKFFLLFFLISFACVIRNLLRNTRNYWPSLASGWNMPTNNIDFRQADWEFWWNSSCGMNFFMRLLIEYSCRKCSTFAFFLSQCALYAAFHHNLSPLSSGRQWEKCGFCNVTFFCRLMRLTEARHVFHSEKVGWGCKMHTKAVYSQDSFIRHHKRWSQQLGKFSISLFCWKCFTLCTPFRGTRWGHMDIDRLGSWELVRHALIIFSIHFCFTNSRYYTQLSGRTESRFILTC